MRRLIVASSLLACLACQWAATAGDEGPFDKVPELKALGALVGNWDTQATFKKAEWTPKEVKVSGSIKSEWTLGGRFVQGKGRDSNTPEVQTHWTYDVNKKAYRMWFFASDGNVAEWAGKWNPDSKTFTLKNDLGNEITDTFVVRIVDANTIELASEAKGKDGKIYFAYEGKWTRRK